MKNKVNYKVEDFKINDLNSPEIFKNFLNKYFHIFTMFIPKKEASEDDIFKKLNNESVSFSGFSNLPKDVISYLISEYLRKYPEVYTKVFEITYADEIAEALYPSNPEFKDIVKSELF